MRKKDKAAVQKERLIVVDFKALLHWKCGDKYSARTKGLKVDELKALWEEVKDQDTLDAVIPSILEETKYSRG